MIDKPGVGVGTNETASSYLTSLMDGKNVFSYPKPVSLIKYLTNFICKDSDIVMDFSQVLELPLMRYGDTMWRIKKLH